MNFSMRSMVAASVLCIAVPASAQVFEAAGFATVSLAGLGNTTTVAGDSRIPILPRDVTFDRATGALHVRATGHHGAVRQLDLDLHGPEAGHTYDVAADGSTTVRIGLEGGTEMTADAGHGSITITAMDERHVTGTYEGTFRHGATPVVVRGHFEANFPRARGNAPTP